MSQKTYKPSLTDKNNITPGDPNGSPDESFSKETLVFIDRGFLSKISKKLGDGEFIFKQKAVDILLALDLISVKNNYPSIKEIVLIASDSDFVPVINNLKKLNIKTILYTYFNAKDRKSILSSSNELIKSVHKYQILTKQHFENARFD